MKITLRAALGLALLLASCSKNHPDKAAASEPQEAVQKEAPASAPSPDSSPTTDDARPLPAAAAPARLLVYHADLRLKVDDLPKAANQLEGLVQQHGGHLSAATEAREESEWRQDMTIRVQPSQFQPLLTALRNLGTVEEQKLTTDDVTAQHADVAARLRTKRAVEKRYVALLSQAKKISEVLEVESKLAEVREDIESTESRLKTLNDEVAYSTISLTCYQPLSRPVHDAPIVSFASRLADSFYTGWSLLTGLFVGLVAIWPFLLLGGVGWVLLRKWRRQPQKA